MWQHVKLSSQIRPWDTVAGTLSNQQTNKHHYVAQTGLPRTLFLLYVCWLLACLASQQHASVSQGRICEDICTCCHTEIEVISNVISHPLSLSLSLSLSLPPSLPPLPILTPGRPVPTLTLSRQAPGMVAPGVPIFESLVSYYGKLRIVNREEWRKLVVKSTVVPQRSARQVASGIRTPDFPLSRRMP